MAALTILILLPFFRFFTDACETWIRVEKAKEFLEIASLSTYTCINPDRIGSGDLEIDIKAASLIFQKRLRELTGNKETAAGISNAKIEFIQTEDGIQIESQASILSAWNKPLLIQKLVEFVLDPAMEVTE